MENQVCICILTRAELEFGSVQNLFPPQKKFGQVPGLSWIIV